MYSCTQSNSSIKPKGHVAFQTTNLKTALKTKRANHNGLPFLYRKLNY